MQNYYPEMSKQEFAETYVHNYAYVNGRLDSLEHMWHIYSLDAVSMRILERHKLSPADLNDAIHTHVYGDNNAAD